ncbi:uncharacterized protein TNCV_1557151 [Trichonephila clavipes]|nr:uncharacterized protein TNCV_1557151 [Trichonephila clavipes]
MEKRGQRLDPNDCIGYYCKQQIGSGSYFASNYPIQRGYGLFSNLRRYAMPIMMKAGKYLGTHLLSTDSRLRYGFSGVYSSDKLPKQRKRYRSFIVNTDPAHFKGRHWQAIYFRQDNHCVFLFIWNTTSHLTTRFPPEKMASKDDRKKLKRGFVEEEEEEYPNVSPKKSVKKGKPQNIFDLDLSPPSSGSHEDEDYDFALLVFRTFKCKKFADYLQLYQQLDVILLAEVFTSFRQKCLQFYKLDPCHFITAADLTWNAGLKYTKVELELFSDINMYLWIENSIRGGICFVGKRYALANNPFIPGFNKHEEESYIIAVDANNLYGYAMSQPLPIGHFFWLTKDEVRNLDVFTLSSTDTVGYF